MRKKLESRVGEVAAEEQEEVNKDVLKSEI